MSYRVFADEHLLMDARLPEYVLIDPILSLKNNEPAKLSFSVPNSNPSREHIHRLKSRIRVYRDNTLIFLGRIIEDAEGLSHTHSYIAEGALAFLLDSIQRPFQFEGSVTELFEQLISSHNAQVDISQQITAGNCTVASTEQLSFSYEDYMTTWAVLKEQLIDRFGGYLVFTYTTAGTPVLHYLADPPDTATQRIEFGSNLASLAVTRNADEVYTACIPLGAKVNEIDENDSSEARLTVADANDGLDYIVDSENAALYGVIYAPTDLTTWEDIKNATYLLQRGQLWLSEQGLRMKRTITLTAVDLHNIDTDVESFHFLDRIIVSCADICPESEFVLTGMEIPLGNPGAATITLGDTKASLISEGIQQNTSAVQRIGAIEADYVTNSAVAGVVSEQIQNNTSILQSAEQILLAALEEYVKTSDYAVFQSSIQTTLSVMAGTIEANFTETTSTVTEIEGEVSEQFETIRSFIRLISSGIVIGKSSSSIKLKLENSILYFFTGDENMVSTQNALAYFSAGKLYVNDVQILTSMRIGPFAWVPESQNLNFKLMET